MIIDRLIENIIKCKNHSVVGLDPKPEFIPGYLITEMEQKYSHKSEIMAEAFLCFNKEIIDNIYDIVPAIKPQIAFYEKYGYQGVKCFYDTCSYAKEKGMIVIGDVKRGDIGTTAEAYSECYLGGAEYSADTDIITVNPYLGSDSLKPFIKDCVNNDKGIFVLVKTSNKSSVDIQDLVCNGKRVYEHTAEMVVELGRNFIGKNNYSFVGAVVGATFSKEAQSLRMLMQQSYFLVPGYGAQGGSAEDAAECFNKDGLGAIVNSSRGIITAYKNDEYESFYGEKNFGVAARAASLKMRDDINYALGKQNKLAW